MQAAVKAPDALRHVGVPCMPGAWLCAPGPVTGRLCGIIYPWPHQPRQRPAPQRTRDPAAPCTFAHT